MDTSAKQIIIKAVYVMKFQREPTVYTWFNYKDAALWIFIIFSDDCVNATCDNGGSCFDEIYNYTCSCVTGFTGQHCETS